MYSPPALPASYVTQLELVALLFGLAAIAVQSSVHVLHWVSVPRRVEHVVSPVHIPQPVLHIGDRHCPEAADSQWLDAFGSVVVHAWPHCPQFVDVSRAVAQEVAPAQDPQPALQVVPHTKPAPASLWTPASTLGAPQVAEEFVPAGQAEQETPQVVGFEFSTMAPPQQCCACPTTGVPSDASVQGPGGIASIASMTD